MMADIFAVSEDVVAREVSGETVLLNLASGMYFGLDNVGGRIWARLSEKPASLSELTDMIEAEFDAPRATIETDLIALMTDLQEQDLIQLAA